MDVKEAITEMGYQARQASHAMALLDTQTKNSVLHAMANAIDGRRATLKDANEQDLEAGRSAGLSSAMLDRLTLTDNRVDAMIQGIRDIIDLPDPIGEELDKRVRPNGIEITKLRVPIGVIGIIYESRPNVTADAAVLCFKASNTVILRGGKEAMRSNRAIADALQEGGCREGMPEHTIQLIPMTDREAIRVLVQLTHHVDMVIPRGGEGLIRTVSDLAHVPVLKHYKGVCHTYVDAHATLEMAHEICVNAKVQRPGVCNAMETLLVHESVASRFLPKLASDLLGHGVELRGDSRSREIFPGMGTATEEDWHAEYLDLILAIRIVPNHQSAIEHINTYGSKHSDAIITESENTQADFTHQVDSSAVFVNSSTRFNDGAEFGLGAEIGISTDKLHARGPMGLEELTTYKYVVQGNGQIRK